MDEDGNPIEAGRENVLYVDEGGNEIPEEAAMELLQSGRYLDSRDLNQDSNASTHSRSAGIFSQATFNASQASLPASAFGSLSKSTGASQMQAEFQRKQQYLQQQHVDSRASFTQSQVKSYADTTQLDSAQNDQLRNDTTLKSVSQADVQKSHSGRRIAQPPPKKSSDGFSSDTEKIFTQQVIDLQNLINQEKQVQEQSRVFEDDMSRRGEDETILLSQGQYQQVPSPRSSHHQSEFFSHNMQYSQEPSLIETQSRNVYRSGQPSESVILNSGDYTEINQATREKLKEFGTNFDILSIKRVGLLYGAHVIHDLSKVDASFFDKYYQNEDDGGSVAFEPTNLDIKPNQFIDPFNPDLFKDEIIDIDFGAIDAFTSALNAQLNAEKTGSQPPQNLQFPSHILTSNHAYFIDNQLLLGDS